MKNLIYSGMTVAAIILADTPVSVATWFVIIASFLGPPLTTSHCKVLNQSQQVVCFLATIHPLVCSLVELALSLVIIVTAQNDALRSAIEPRTLSKPWCIPE